MKQDLYIIQKYVMAESVEDALEKEKKVKIKEVFIDSKWREHKTEKIIDKKIYKQ